MNGNSIKSGIRDKQKPHHDTLYCTTQQKNALLRTIAGNGSSLRADNLQISGLEVFCHDDFDRPIVCEKGEVFTLAKDYKGGEHDDN